MMKKVKCVELGRVYDSLSDASKELNINKANISSACNGRLKRAGGYHFEYIDNVSNDNENIKDNLKEISALKAEIESLRQENDLLKQRIKALQEESTINNETDKFEALKKQYNAMIEEEGYKEESYSSTDTTVIKDVPKQEEKQQEECFSSTRWGNLPPEISSFNAEQYNNEIESCNDMNRLIEIISACNDVLRKCYLYKEQNEFADTNNLKLVEYDAREVRTKALNRKNIINNPVKSEPEKIPFEWNEAEIFTNNMMLNEICRFDEMMCESAIEAHEKEYAFYSGKLAKGTSKESEYKARKEFEEEYLTRLKEHYQKLINERVERNKDYESRNFGFAQFAELKKNLEWSLEKVNTMMIDNKQGASTVKNCIETHRKKIEKDLRELNDSITNDGVVYNKYSLAMRYQIVDIAESKLKAFENNDTYLKVVNEEETKAIESLHSMMNDVSRFDIDRLQILKEKLLNKIKCKNEKENSCFVSSLCVVYRMIEDELQARY